MEGRRTRKFFRGHARRDGEFTGWRTVGLRGWRWRSASPAGGAEARPQAVVVWRLLSDDPTERTGLCRWRQRRSGELADPRLVNLLALRAGLVPDVRPSQCAARRPEELRNCDAAQRPGRGGAVVIEEMDVVLHRGPLFPQVDSACRFPPAARLSNPSAAAKARPTRQAAPASIRRAVFSPPRFLVPMADALPHHGLA